MKFKLFILSIFLTVIIFSAAAQTLLLPITGVQAEEVRTIAAFVTMTIAPDAVDQSRNTSLVPAGGRPWGVGPGARTGIVKLINDNNAKSAVGINVVPYGAGKMATIRFFTSEGALDNVLDIQYSDPFEFWIKLQQPAETTRRADGGIVWVIYRQGVNRAEAEELMHLWFSDLVSMGSQGLKDIDDQTAGFEAAIITLRGTEEVGRMRIPDGDWMKLMDRYIIHFKSTKITADDRSYRFYNIEEDDSIIPDFLGIIGRNTPEGHSKSRANIIIDVSRQGNRTRIEVVRSSYNVQGSFITEYTSAAEFRRNLRSTSLRLMDTLYREPLEYARANEAIRSTWMTSAALNDLKTHVAIPNTFIQVTRPPAAPGEIPRGGGFYMSRNLVTQREWEAVMGANPSAVKGATLPVHNVSMVEAMEYCNRLSLRDGLMPAYDVFYWAGLPTERTLNYTSAGRDPIRWTETITEYNGQTATVRTNKYANGYRLPTSEEWAFALTGGNVTLNQFIAQLTESNEIENVGWFETNSNGRPHPVGQKRAINGFYDMLGNVTEYVFDGSFEHIRYDRRMIRHRAATLVRGGDYRSPIIYHQYIIDDLGRTTVANDPNLIQGSYLSLPTMRERTFKVGIWNDTVDRYIIPGFRIVRPVFDYWAYRSGE